MDYTNQPADLLADERPKALPSTLNVLTILTLIGCALSYLGGIYNFYQASNIDKAKAEMEENFEKMGDSETASKMMEGSMEMLQKSYDNRYIILAVTLVFTTLCLIGALQMRKLKKSGYPIYVVGEIVPVILTIALLGFNLLTGLATGFSLLVAIVFVILYTTQRKHLVY